MPFLKSNNDVKQIMKTMNSYCHSKSAFFLFLCKVLHDLFKPSLVGKGHLPVTPCQLSH